MESEVEGPINKAVCTPVNWLMELYAFLLEGPLDV